MIQLEEQVIEVLMGQWLVTPRAFSRSCVRTTGVQTFLIHHNYLPTPSPGCTMFNQHTPPIFVRPEEGTAVR